MCIAKVVRFPELIKGLVFLEPSAMPEPRKNDLSRLSNIPQIFIWGDFLDEYITWNKGIPDTNSYYKTVKNYFEELKKVTNKAEWLELPDIGIKGNTHMLIHDRNSLEIAALVQSWFEKHNFI